MFWNNVFFQDWIFEIKQLFNLEMLNFAMLLPMYSFMLFFIKKHRDWENFDFFLFC